jgi:hypothetical protein
MKKSVKIILGIIIVLILLSVTFGIIDNNRTKQGKEPIFCINQSGGSVILYVGPGYVIDGAWDDVPGGLENTKISTWIGWLIRNK